MSNIIDMRKEFDGYVGPQGETLRREYGLTPAGNPIRGFWVLRNPEGEFVDYNQYINDIIDRYNINLTNR
jgi:hypothetical protein